MKEKQCLGALSMVTQPKHTARKDIGAPEKTLAEAWGF